VFGGFVLEDEFTLMLPLVLRFELEFWEGVKLPDVLNERTVEDEFEFNWLWVLVSWLIGGGTSIKGGGLLLWFWDGIGGISVCGGCFLWGGGDFKYSSSILLRGGGSSSGEGGDSVWGGDGSWSIWYKFKFDLEIEAEPNVIGIGSLQQNKIK